MTLAARVCRRPMRLHPVEPSALSAVDCSQQGVSIGRDQLPGENKKVSRLQATLHVDANGLHIERVGAARTCVVFRSGPPWFVELERAQRVALAVGDEVQIFTKVDGQDDDACVAWWRCVADEGESTAAKPPPVGESSSAYHGSERELNAIAELAAMGYGRRRAIAAVRAVGVDLSACVAFLEDGEGSEEGAAGGSEARKRSRTAPPAAAPPAPLGWQLNTLHSGWVEAGLVPERANDGTCALTDLLSADALRGVTELHMHNFMIDLDWMLHECPAIRSVRKVVVLHGDGKAPTSTGARREPHRYEMLQPPCERYGTHHSKALFLVRPDQLTVHVTTANFIFGDWYNKTNGVWTCHMPASRAPFPPLDERPTTDGFEKDLYDYLHGLKALGLRPPPQWSPQGHAASWAALDLSWIRKYDYAACPARLVASMPGRHVGAALQMWGHMAARRLIDAEPLASTHSTAPLVLQFSSLSSPGTNTTWLAELTRSFCGPQPQPSAVEIVFPTQAQVGNSLEGWIAGSSIPCDVGNAERLRAHLSALPGTAGVQCGGYMCTWDGGNGAHGGSSGRALAVPHIKSYCRYDAESRTLAWALLGSQNLSQAAWGKLEKNGSQLYIKSYELGVLLLPSLLPTSAASGGGSSGDAPCLWVPRRGDSGAPPAGSMIVPLPYALPPVRYAPNDTVWSTSEGGMLPRTQTAVRPDRHGRHPGEPGGFYGRGATAKELAERTLAQAQAAAGTSASRQR